LSLKSYKLFPAVTILTRDTKQLEHLESTGLCQGKPGVCIWNLDSGSAWLPKDNEDLLVQRCTYDEIFMDILAYQAITFSRHDRHCREILYHTHNVQQYFKNSCGSI